jgi:hypothetical protein
MELPWLRWRGLAGSLFPTSPARIEQANQRAAQLAEQLKALGIKPEDSAAL